MTDGLSPLRTGDGRPPRLVHAGASRARAMVLAVLAESLGCRTEHHTTAAGFVAALLARPADMAVIDGQMPDLTVGAVVDMIGAVPCRRNLPVIVLRGAATERDVLPARCRTLAEPYSPRDLRAALAAALNAGAAAGYRRTDPVPDVRSRLSAALNSAPKISATATM